MSVQNDEIQQLTIRAASGTFTLSAQGYTTPAIPCYATSWAVEQAINALPPFSPSQVRVDNSGPYRIRFTGARVAEAPQSLLTVGAGGLVGGLSNFQGLVTDSLCERPSPWYSLVASSYSGMKFQVLQSSQSNCPRLAWVVGGVEPGVRYRVWVNFFYSDGSREPRTTYTVRDGSLSSSLILGTYEKDQRSDPPSRTFSSPAYLGNPFANFHSLGTVQFSGTSGRIEVGYSGDQGTNAVILADAVVLEALDATVASAQIARIQAGTVIPPENRRSLVFLGGAAIRTRNRYPEDANEGSLLSNSQVQASVACSIQIDSNTAGVLYPFVWGQGSYPPLFCVNAGTSLRFGASYHRLGETAIRRDVAEIVVPNGLETSHDWVVVYDGSGTEQADAAILKVYRDGELAGSSAVASEDRGFVKPLNYNGNWDAVVIGSPNSTSDITIDDFVLWGGYAATAQDAADITNQVKRRTEISPDDIFFSVNGDGGTTNQSVLVSDSGITNRGLPDYDVDIPTASGTMLYGAPLVYQPPVVVAEARIMPSRTMVLLDLQTRNGQPATILGSQVTQDTFRQPGKRASLHILRDGSNVAEVHYLVDPLWSVQTNRNWLAFLFPSGVDPLGDNDTARLVTPRHWIQLVEGYCDATDIECEVGSVLPEFVADSKTMQVGYNFQPNPQSGPANFGNHAKNIGAFRSASGGSLTVDEATGEPRPTPGQTAVSSLLSNGPPNYPDPCITRENQAHETINPYYNNVGYGTAGMKLGYGVRSIPRKGKAIVSWDYLPGRQGDGEAWIQLGELDPRTLPPGYSDYSAQQVTGPQVKSWDWLPSVQAGSGLLGYKREHAYECFDPALNPADPHGSVLSPVLSLAVTGGVTNYRVTFAADSGEPEEVWNVDPVNVPSWHPYFTAEVLRGAKAIRSIHATGVQGSSNSRYSDWTLPGHVSYADLAWDRLPFGELVTTIARVEPVRGAELVAIRLRFPSSAGGVCSRIVTTVPHNLDTGATLAIVNQAGGLSLVETVERRQAYLVGDTAQVLSPTEFIVWSGLTDQAPGDRSSYELLRTYTGAELGNLYVRHNRLRTIPLDLLCELCGELDADLHFVLPHAYANSTADDPDNDGIESRDSRDIRLTAAHIADSLPSDRKVLLEYTNEIWNWTMPYFQHGMHIIEQFGGLPGRGATLKVTALDANGGIAAVAIDQPGSGYFAGKVVFGGSGSNAVAYIQAHPTTGAVVAVNITTPGSNYGTPNASNPSGIPGITAVIGGGSGAVLQVTGISGGVIQGVTIVSGGTGYSPNMLAFRGGQGSGAWATFSVNGSGTITGVTLGSGGSGYQPGVVVDILHSFIPGRSTCSVGEVQTMYTILGSKVARIFREEFVRAGRSASDVEWLLNVGPGIYSPELLLGIRAHNLQADPMTRVDRFSVNTYWEGYQGHIGGTPIIPVATLDGLTVEQDLDLLEIEAIDPGFGGLVTFWRNTLDEAGLNDVTVDSYEGGQDNLATQVISQVPVGNYTPSEATMVAQARRALRLIGTMRHPRMYGITLSTLQKFQDRGLVRFQRFNANNPWQGTLNPPHLYAYWNWGDYTSFGQLAGIGDGSDGLWDNQVSAQRPGAAYSEGSSVSPSAAALKLWSSLIGAAQTNNRPTLTLPVGPLAGTTGVPVTFTATATDPDAGQTLTFSLGSGSPSGATIDAETGAFTWTPSQAGTVTITVRVTDNGSPPLSTTGTVVANVVATQTNSPPTLTMPPGTLPGMVNVPMTFTAIASDPDAGQTLTFSLEPGSPVGATINAQTGVFVWTPTQAGTVTVAVRVTDNGSPPLSAVGSASITTAAANRVPTLSLSSSTIFGTVDVPVTFTATAGDPDPGQFLTFGLDPLVPAGATIDPQTGVFTWTPSQAGVFLIRVSVSDSGNPTLRAAGEVSIWVSVATNYQPTLTLPPGPLSGAVGAPVTFTATATDPDVGQTLTFSLDPGSPEGATIDAETGVFTWTPTQAGTSSIAVRVTDDGSPAMSASGTVTVIVPATAPSDSSAGRAALEMIITAMREKLVANGVVSEQCCQSVLEPEPFLAWGQPFISVLPGLQLALEKDIMGGGRAMNSYTGFVLIRVYIRSRIDPLELDTNALLSANPMMGILTLMKRIMSSLQTFLPATPEGTSLLNQPMICRSYGEIVRPYAYRDVLRGEMKWAVEYIDVLSDDCDYQQSYAP